ncbi:MAG: sucrase ferredoxin, partial [Candidatus Limnocylindria bacterium]
RMSLEAPMRCSALAAALDEPMIGSVEQRMRWLLVEDRSAWGADAVKDVLGSELPAAAKARGVRVLLVKRREADPSADRVRRAFLVDVVERRIAARRVTDLAELSVDAIADAPVEAFGDPASEPMFLVCTNGKRDACCALRGRPLMSALSPDHGERTWECTHLGGHRFAGNLVCLPDGIVYGRVAADEGPRLAAAYASGHLDPSLLRGRSAWPAPAQVAEQSVRQRLGLTRVAGLDLVGAEIIGENATVVLAEADGTAHRVELRSERLPPARAVSCSGEKVEEPIHWLPLDDAERY